MSKTITDIILILVFVGAAYYVITAMNSDATPPAASPAPGTGVNIVNFSFNPATLTVTTGTKVTWTNNDVVAHTVTSDTSNLLDSREIAPGQSFSFTFSTPGTVTYHCAIHTTMKGTIVVTN